MIKSAQQIARDRRRREVEQTERITIAAGDGDYETVLEMLETGTDPECQDPGEYSPLSEASSQGHIEIVKLLLDFEADPNSVGELKRTPIWRAAWNDHTDVIQVLLEAGADPRIMCQNQRAHSVCSVSVKASVFDQWNIERTDSMKLKNEARHSSRRVQTETAALVTTSAHTGLDDVEELQSQHQSALRLLKQTQESYNSYAADYDGMCSPCYEGTPCKEVLDTTLGALHSAEQRIKDLNDSIRFIEQRLAQARALERNTRRQSMNANVTSWDTQNHHHCAPGFQRAVKGLLMINARIAEGDVPNSRWIWMPDDLLIHMIGFLPHVRIDLQVSLREVEDVVLKDWDGALSKQPQWPLLVDMSGQALTFLKYRDTVFLDSFTPHALDVETVRHAILGGLRYGRSVVVSLGDLDVLHGLGVAFDKVQKGLLDAVMDKSIRRPEKYLQLRRPEDDEEYDPSAFNPVLVSLFRFILVTTCKRPCLALQGQVYIIGVQG
uniref:Uncharacterized protein n=1 Tax=Eutreptiella gymnastica TaxID=73025 RepID=A0A7S4C9I6_9EUGL